MTEKMQAVGSKESRTAVKQKKAKNTAPRADGFSKPVNEQQRGDVPVSVPKKPQERPLRLVADRGEILPDAHESAGVSEVSALEAMKSLLQKEVDTVQELIEKDRTTIKMRRKNSWISAKEEKSFYRLLDKKLAELDKIVQMANTDAPAEEIFERLNALHNDLDLNTPRAETSAIVETPQSENPEYGFEMVAGIEIADANQGGSHYRIEQVEGNTVSCILLSQDENYVGTLVFDRSDPKNVGRFSQVVRPEERVDAKEESVEPGNESEEWQELFAQCSKDAHVLLDVMTDSAKQLIALLREEIGAGFDQSQERAALSAYFEKVLVQVGNITLDSDREHAIDIVMRRISRNALQ